MYNGLHHARQVENMLVDQILVPVGMGYAKQGVIVVAVVACHDLGEIWVKSAGDWLA